VVRFKLQHQLDRRLGGLHIWYRHNDEEIFA
jgi:hypothetical protein